MKKGNENSLPRWPILWPRFEPSKYKPSSRAWLTEEMMDYLIKCIRIWCKRKKLKWNRRRYDIYIDSVRKELTVSIVIPKHLNHKVKLITVLRADNEYHDCYYMPIFEYLLNSEYNWKNLQRATAVRVIDSGAWPTDVSIRARSDSHSFTVVRFMD